MSIITGFSMAGKTTYLMQCALIVIMAQIGCFVPAESAALPIVHQLLTRIAHDEGQEVSASTFSREMSEVAHILREADKGTLVLIDELGRGTSTDDGLAIALAVSEALLSCAGWVFFTTHFVELQELLGMKVGCAVYHLQVEHNAHQNRLTMLYRLQEGILLKNVYGIELARTLPLSLLMLNRADEIQTSLKAKLVNDRDNNRLGRIVKRRKGLIALREYLASLVRAVAREGNQEVSGIALRNSLSTALDQFTQQVLDSV